MTRVTPQLARAIDRLSRRAHRFHRFAHHPLCDEYAGELVRLGRRGRVCRGCAYAAIGCATGLVAGAATPLPLQHGPLIAFGTSLAAAGGALVVAAMIARPLRPDVAPVRQAARARVAIASPVRPSKLCTRMLPFAVLACALGISLRVGGAVGAFCVAFALAAAGLPYAAYRKRGPARGPCAACPERALPRVCRGYAPIVRRERALQRVAGRWIAARSAAGICGPPHRSL